MRRKNILLMVLLVTLPASRLTATVLLFENVRLPIDKEMAGLQSVPGYGDHVTGTGAGGFTDSFSMGNGWTPNIALDFSAGNDRKTVNTWRDGWDGGDGANYLLDGDPRPRGSGLPGTIGIPSPPGAAAGLSSTR